MAKQPAIMFYTGDWMKDPALRSVSIAARGLWMDLLCLMHESPRRGYLQHANGKPVTAEQVARMTGCSTDEVSQLLQELEYSGVFSCTEHGVIYSRRIVRDESMREKRRIAGKKGGNPILLKQNATKTEAKRNQACKQKRTPSSSSSSSSSDKPPPPTSSPNSTRDPPDRTGGGGGFLSDSVPDQTDERKRLQTRLANCGVRDVMGTLSAIDENGVSVEEAHAVVDHWQAQRPKWQPGALHWRLTRGAAGQDPTAGWPDTATDADHERAKEELFDRAARASRAGSIIRNGRRSGRSDSQIASDLAAAGMKWEDVDA